MTRRRRVKAGVPVDVALGAAGVPVDVALRSADALGEAPVWLDETGELLRVDITAAALHRWAPASGRSARVDVGDCVTAAVPRRAGGLAVVRRHHVELWDAGGAVCERAVVETGRPGNRCNDAKCDPAGRLWVGTMSTARVPGAAALYRLEPGGRPERVIAGTTISNGLGWSPSGERMYFADSLTGRVDVLDYDRDSGSVRRRRPLARIDRGIPDGLAVDADGALWVCLFGGGEVHRYTPAGELDAVAALPVSNPTSATFGGDDLGTLYVTSARHRLSPRQLAAEPLAGAVFALRPATRGLPADRFAG